jgi:ASC-1-like (ASCH) protein
MVSINKLRKRNTSTNNSDDIHSQYIEDYQLYFDNALNKVKYKDKYNSNISGEGILLDVSEINQKNGDEKWMTTLPNSNIELMSVIALEFAKDVTEYWIVEDKENLAIPSHEKFKISPLCFLGTLIRYGQDNIQVDTKVINSSTNTTEKKVYFSPKATNIKAGDFLYYDKEKITYLVTEVQNFTNLPYATSKKCNQLLKWMFKGNLYDSMSIVTNQTKYTLGQKVLSSAGIAETDSRFQIELPYNNITKNIKIGQRFIFNDGAWRVTQTDRVSEYNIYSLLLGQDSINNEIDDVDNEIAGAKVSKHTYTYDIPTSISIEKYKFINLVYSIKDEKGNDFDYSLVTVMMSNNYDNLIQVTNNKGVISIKGLDIGTGSITLSVPSGEKSKDFVIPFEVKSVVVDKIDYKVTTSNGYTYRIKEGATIS